MAIPQARHNARCYALQALYQWQIAGQDLSEIELQFFKRENMSKVDVDYFRELLHGVPTHLNQVDASLTPLLDRTLDEVDPIELAILRMGTYELMKRPDVPYKVVINEALELAKRFGATDGHKYVNGILDRVVKHLRSGETTS